MGADPEAKPEVGWVVEEPKRPLRPKQCSKYLQQELAKAFPKIVAGFITEAVNGGCAHMKVAVELLEQAKESERKKGSAQRFLERLGE